MRNCEFWTAVKVFFDAVKIVLTFGKYLPDISLCFAYYAELKGIYGQGQTFVEPLQDVEQSLDIALDNFLERSS